MEGDISLATLNRSSSGSSFGSAPSFATKTRNAVQNEYAVSEKEELKSFNTDDFFNHLRSKLIQEGLQSDAVPDVAEDVPGSDQKWYRTPYYEILNAHRNARLDGIIKIDDKKYINDKLFASFWFANSQFVMSVIVDTFRIVSRKQKLESDIIDKLMEFIIPEKWEKRLDEYKFPRVNQFEIDTNVKGKYVRLAAIEAVFNNALIDNRIANEDRKEHIKRCLNDHGCEDDIDDEFKEWLKKFLLNFDVKPNPTLFKESLADLNSSDDCKAKRALKYVTDQSVIENRKHLFENDALLVITNVIGSSKANDKTKLGCCIIVGNCMQHQVEDKIAEAIENLSSFIKSRHFNDSVVQEAIKCILLATQKYQWSKQLTEAFGDLLNRLDKGDEEMCNLIILILSSVMESQLDILNDILTFPVLMKLATKLSDPTLVVGEGIHVRFVKSVMDNQIKKSNAQALSTVIAHIFSLCQLGNLSADGEMAQLFDELSKCLDPSLQCNKQTRIRISRILAQQLRQRSCLLQETTLNQLQKSCSDQVADVGIYSTIAFIKGLVHFSIKTKDHLPETKIDRITKLYLGKQLQFEGENVTQVVNEGILQIFIQEQRKGWQLTEQVLRLMTAIVTNRNSGNADHSGHLLQALYILESYSQTSGISPVIISSLEDMILADSNQTSNKAWSIMRNVINRRTGSVSDKMIRHLVNLFFSSLDESQRREALELLGKVDKIPEEVQLLFDMERRGFSITKGENIEENMNFISQQVKRGNPLSIANWKVLEPFLKIPLYIRHVLFIYRSALENQQQMPGYIIHSLANAFEPSLVDYFCPIFYHLILSNQQLPQELETKLDEELQNLGEFTGDESQFWLIRLFLIKACRGLALSPISIKKMVDIFTALPEGSLKWDFFPAVASIIENRIKFHDDIAPRVADILFNGIVKDMEGERCGRALKMYLNQLVPSGKTKFQKLSDKVLLSRSSSYKFLTVASQMYSQITAKKSLAVICIDTLLEKASQTNNRKQHHIILDLLGHLQRPQYKEFLQWTENQINHFKLIQLCSDPLNEKTLENIYNLVREGIPLTEKAFQKLHELFQEKSAMQDRILELLLHVPNLQQIPEDFTESIVIEKNCRPNDKFKAVVQVLGKFSKESIVNQFQTVPDPLDEELDNSNTSATVTVQDFESAFRLEPSSIEQLETLTSLVISVMNQSFFEKNPEISQKIVQLLKISSLTDGISLKIFLLMRAEIYESNWNEEWRNLENDFYSSVVSETTSLNEINWTTNLILLDIMSAAEMEYSEKIFFLNSCIQLSRSTKFKVSQFLIHLSLAYERYPLATDDIMDVIQLVSCLDPNSVIHILRTTGTEWAFQIRLAFLKKQIQTKLGTELQLNERHFSLLAEVFPKGKAETIVMILGKIHSVGSFVQLVQVFKKINKCNFRNFSKERYTLSEFLLELEVTILIESCRNNGDGAHNMSNVFASLIISLFNQGFTSEQLSVFLSNLQHPNPQVEQERANNLRDFLQILVQYSIPSNHFEKLKQALNSDHREWILQANSIAIHSCSRIQKIKMGLVLLEEFDKLNPEMKSILGYDETLAVINKMKENSKYSQWDKRDITEWAAKVKTSKSVDIEEALAIISRAVWLQFEFRLTDVQILSCFTAWKHYVVNEDREEHKRGLIEQVVTGSGKTMIISILAILFAVIKSKKIDIITSNKVLAERDAKKLASFYAIFGLSVDHNADRSQHYTSGPKDCYRKDIVYGEATQFQFDILRDEYSDLGTLAGRSGSMAIVDEVDTNFLDDYQKLARLSSTIPGMDQLNSIYFLIWRELKQLQERLIQWRGQLLYFYGKLTWRKHLGVTEVQLEYLPDNSVETKVITDLSQYLQEGGSIDNIGMQVQDLDRFLREHLEKYIDACVSNTSSNNEYHMTDEMKLRIPAHLRRYVEIQLPKWIENALIAAYVYKENVHYVVQNGCIKPVDFDSTGIIQSSTQWSEGLHQFLQLKHRLEMTPETLTTNYLSTMGFFKRYQDSGLIGLTGTVGSEHEKQFTRSQYHVDLAIIPEAFEKQYIDLASVLTRDENEWKEEIVESTLFHTKQNRGVLIVCETIQSAHDIEKQFRSSHRPLNIKLYTMNDQNQESVVKQIEKGEIIIATILAGRGTDIKTDAIEGNGGLHVCLTFRPPNQRVEGQIFGRTARQGNCGTGQIISNHCNALPSKDEVNQKFSSVAAINYKDKLFAKFCKLLKWIRNRAREDEINKTWLGRLKQKCGFKDEITVYQTCLASAVEERWALFLHYVENKTGMQSYQDLETKYNSFEDKIKEDYEKDCLIKNPYYYITIGNDHCLHQDFKNGQVFFEKANELDPDCCSASWLGEAWCWIGRKLDDYKKVAVQKLQKCMEILTHEITTLTFQNTLLSSPFFRVEGNELSDLEKQIIQHMALIGNIQNSVEGMISAVKVSQRLMDVEGTNDNQRESVFDLERKFHSENNITAFMRSKFDQVKGKPHGESLPTSLNNLKNFMGNFDKFKVSFHSLTTRYDTITKDQAVDVVKEVNRVTGKDYSGIEIALPGFNNQDALQFLEKLPVDITLRTRLQTLRADEFLHDYFDFPFPEMDVELEATTEELVKVAGILLQSNLEDNIVFVIDHPKERCFKFPKESKLIEKIQRCHSTKLQLKHFALKDVAVFKSFPDVSFSVQFISKNQPLKRFLRDRYKGDVEISAIAMNMEIANKVIPVIRDLNLSFVLEFADLNRKMAEEIFKIASRIPEEDMEIKETKNISSLFLDNDQPKDALQMLSLRGLDILIQISEKQFVPWTSILCVGILGSAQLAAGGLLICTGFGATAGLALVTEGASDFVTATTAYRSRNFSWKSYATQKAISVTISVATMGLNALKNAGKGVQTVSGVEKSALAEAGSQIITDGISQKLILETSGRNLSSLAMKQIGVTIAESFARYGLNSLVDSAIDKGLDYLQQDLSREIQSKVQSQFQEKDFPSGMFTLANVERSLIEMKQENQQNNFWESVAQPLLTGIFSDPKYLGNKFTLGMRVFGNLQGITEIYTIIDDVHQQLKQKLDKLNQDLHKDEYTEDVGASTSQVQKKISDYITGEILHITKSKLISPWSSAAVGALVNRLSVEIQSRFIVNPEEDSVSRQNIQGDSSDANGKSTIQSQIMDNAEDYMKAYSICEISYFAQSIGKDKNNFKSQKEMKQVVEKRATQIEGEGQPAGLAEMTAMIAMNNINAKIVDENYIPTQEDIENNVKIIVYCKSETGPGHWRLYGKDETSDRFGDCGYEVIQEITGRDVNELRADLAALWRGHPEAAGSILTSETWVANNYPNEMFNLLFIGAGEKLLYHNNDENYPGDIPPLNDNDKIYRQLFSPENQKKILKNLGNLLEKSEDCNKDSYMLGTCVVTVNGKKLLLYTLSGNNPKDPNLDKDPFQGINYKNLGLSEPPILITRVPEMDKGSRPCAANKITTYMNSPEFQAKIKSNSSNMEMGMKMSEVFIGSRSSGPQTKLPAVANKFENIKSCSCCVKALPQNMEKLKESGLRINQNRTNQRRQRK